MKKSILLALTCAATMTLLGSAHAETGVPDTGFEVSVDASLDAPDAIDAFDATDASLDDAADVLPEATADSDDALDTEPPVDTMVVDTFTPDTTPVDMGSDTVKDTAVTVLDSAGPIIDHVTPIGPDTRTRASDDDAASCTYGTGGRASAYSVLAVLPLVVLTRRRRR